MKKPRVGWVVDRKDWAQDQRGSSLRQTLPDFNIQIITPRNQWLRKSSWRVRWDALFFASWRTSKALMDIVEDSPNRCLAGVGSHYEIGPDIYSIPRGRNPQEVFGEAVNHLKKFRYVLVSSERLWNILHPHVNRAIYSPNGVDSGYWHPTNKGFDNTRVRVGWLGVEKKAKNIPLLRDVERALEWKSCTTDFIVRSRENPAPYTQDEVRGFYGRWDFSLCVSHAEGMSNVLLESASCGVPGITVDVGDHCKLIKEGETGFIIEPTAESLIATVERLQYLQPWEYRKMSEQIRAEIEREWTWKKRAPAFRRALEATCH